MTRFKGRVVNVSGNKITIDTSTDVRIDKDFRVLKSAWVKPEIPKLGAVVRCIFRSKDKAK